MLNDVVEVAAGAYHSLARRGDGTVYAWGYGLHGQLGSGQSLDQKTPQAVSGLLARTIAAGGTHSLAIRTDGMLVAWGYNASGQLGNPETTISSSTPVLVLNTGPVAAIAAGLNHSVAVSPSGTVKTWGSGEAGQLGSGSFAAAFVPQAVFEAGGPWGGTEPPTLSVPSGTYRSAQSVVVTSTQPDAVFRYTENGATPTEADAQIASGAAIAVDEPLTLRVRAWPASGAPSLITSATYVLQPAAPTIAPGAGTYATEQAVTLTGSTPGGIVRFTLDGSDPTENSSAYTGPLTVTETTTVRARVFRTGWLPSEGTAAAIEIAAGTLQVPVASPPGGTYSEPQAVTLAATPDAEIRYTLDGMTPTTSSVLYSGPIQVGFGVTTLKARAFRTDWLASPVLTETYHVALATVTIQVFHWDEDAPNGQGPAAEAGVRISINGKVVGQTGPDGTLTVQAAPGDLSVTAALDEEWSATGSIHLVPGGTATLMMVLDDGRATSDNVSLSLVEATEGIIPRPSQTFTLQFYSDGVPVAVSRLEFVQVLNREGRLAYPVTQLFTIADGRVAAVDAASLYDWLPVGELVTLSVQAVDEAEVTTYAADVRFHVGRFKLALNVIAPPSNPALSAAHIGVRISVIGSEVVVRRTTDGSGRIELPWLPHATLLLEAETQDGLLFYYARATTLHSADRSGSLVLRHMSDIVGGVPPLLLDVVPNETSAEEPQATALWVSGGVEGAKATATEGKRPERDVIPPGLRAWRAELAARELPPTARAPWRRLSTATATAMDPKNTIDLQVTSHGADETVSNAATLTVPQGTKKVTLKYAVASTEYPRWVQEQSPFDDVWSVAVFAGPGGRQLFQSWSNVNAQLHGNPAWQADGSTGEIQEELDVESLAAEASLDLTLHATTVNVRDHLFSTTVSAELGGQATLEIKAVSHDLVPGTKGDSTYYSVPRLGKKNVNHRWFTLDIAKPEEATVSRVRLTISSETGAQLHQAQFDVGGTDKNIHVKKEGRQIEVRSTFATTESTINSTPPTTHGLRYDFVVEATQPGQPTLTSKEKGRLMNALWRKPDGFGRYSDPEVELGHDDWSSKATYEWLERNRWLISRINDISGEHARDLVHKTHTKGTDIDMFHYFTFPGGAASGRANYTKLRESVIAALNGDGVAMGRLQNWILATRSGLAELLATGQVAELRYALGTNPKNATVSLPVGWAASLMRTGKLVVGQETLLETHMGIWERAEDDRIIYVGDHNDHIHIALNVK